MIGAFSPAAGALGSAWPRRVRGGMSVLEESRSYGLSSGKLSHNVSVYHVKLTDSAARALSAHQNTKGWSSHPSICFSGNQGRITIPCSSDHGDVRNFTFGVTNIAPDNPHASFDCIQQLCTSGAEQLSCLGVIQKKMIVKATDDSYDKALQSMAQAEEETRSRGAIVIKHRGRHQGKRVTVRAPAPALARLAKPRPPSQLSLANSSQSKSKRSALKRRSSDVQERPLRDRVTHLLALRPYKKPELILRLQRDGLTAADKTLLDSVLTEVGQLSARDSSYLLKDSVYKELHKDWPGYSSGDQQLLKRILVRRLFQPHQNLLTVPEAQVSPLRDTPNSSPSRRHKHSIQEGNPEPPGNKKPRISHFSRKTACDESKLRPSAAPGTGEEKYSLDSRQLFDSLSTASLQQEGAKRLNTEEPTDQRPHDSTQAPSPPTAPRLSKNTIKRKKGKHKDGKKDRGQSRKERRKGRCTVELSGETHLDLSKSDVTGDSGVQTDQETADYLLKYTVIVDQEQRQSYKQEFNKEYSEYRNLHAHIDGVTRQFMELDSQLKQLHPDRHKYKAVRNQILQHYCYIKKSNPNYNQDKTRCEYLHKKLAHIKKLISDYDQQQLSHSN
ncbi:RNA polymerase II elongation factor ELL-like isoform 1-T1 [Synchiropus picturatus]